MARLCLIPTQIGKEYQAFPLGLISMATYLEKTIGYKETRIIDPYYDDILEKAKEYEPGILGISAMSNTYGEAIRNAKALKQHYKVPVIIGGPHISLLPESLDRVFDIGVIGEGEETIKELMELYLNDKELPVEKLQNIKGLVYWKDDQLIQTQRRPLIENLDTIPVPDYTYADKRYFKPQEVVDIAEMCVRASVLTSRGCPYKCIFCATTRFWDKVRMHSPAYVAKTIRYLYDNFNCTYFNICDDMFTVNKKRLKDIGDALKEEGLLGKVMFTCNPRVNTIDDEMCSIMKSLNIKTVNFGFESGSDRVLRYLKGETVSVEMNKNAIKLCHKHGITVYGSLMFGSPTETLEEMKETLNFIDWSIKNGADYIWSFVATPFPCTEFWEEAKKRGKVSDNMDWDLLSHHNIDNPFLTAVDKEEFKKVFIEGRKKLLKFKYLIIGRILIRHPIKVLIMFFSDPIGYLYKLWVKVFKH